MRKMGAVLVALLLLAAAVTACGSSGGSSSSSPSTESAEAPASTESAETTGEEPEAGGGGGSSALATAEATVEELAQRPTSIGLSTPMKKSPPLGKTVDYLQCGSPICVSLGETLTEAGEKVDWKINIVDEGLTPEKLIAAWTKALGDEPDAIILSGGYPQEIYEKQLEQADQKGIPVISQGDAAPAGNGITAAVDGPQRWEHVGEKIGEILLAESGGKADILFANPPYILSDALYMERAEEYLAENCPECTVESFDLSASSQDPAADTAAQIQSRPNVEYVVPPYADFAQGLPAALKSIGRDEVDIITQALSPTSAEYLKKGENVTAVYGYPGVEIQWRLIDTVGRIFNGEDTKIDEEVNYPEWLFTKESLPADVKNPGYFAWVEEYESQYLALWGVK
jgi:ribose transport system substrate-binding protein